jgi:hypothetical protein
MIQAFHAKEHDITEDIGAFPERAKIVSTFPTMSLDSDCEISDGLSEAIEYVLALHTHLWDPKH